MATKRATRKREMRRRVRRKRKKKRRRRKRPNPSLKERYDSAFIDNYHQGSNH